MANFEYRREQTPAEAYETLTALINLRLARLVEMQATGGVHATTPKDARHGGHVGDLTAIADDLKKITDRCFKEGEFAE